MKRSNVRNFIHSQCSCRSEQLAMLKQFLLDKEAHDTLNYKFHQMKILLFTIRWFQ